MLEQVVSIRPVIRDDLDTLFALSVHPAQRGFVAPNAITLAEIHYITGGYAFTIRKGPQITGLLALIDFREHDDLLDGDDPDAAFLLRLMVGGGFQRQGIGRAALNLAIAWARSRGNGSFQTSFAPGNDGAQRFYELMGLRTTGRIVEGEVEMSMPLG
jgi:diamine N-acetyltransferase